ncbi:hypothetical protein CEXT_283431 [Caerostris extrusa]|uniref:Uncharacterized protein n=1 Tax=Caerostris extrusa TaxID=172846 RepID=A0AAV4Y4J8_CAEEX|nr:hypothetical protein CEXT_283431 [Caerostris extrusa]
MSLCHSKNVSLLFPTAAPDDNSKSEISSFFTSRVSSFCEIGHYNEKEFLIFLPPFYDEKFQHVNETKINKEIRSLGSSRMHSSMAYYVVVKRKLGIISGR